MVNKSQIARALLPFIFVTAGQSQSVYKEFVFGAAKTSPAYVQVLADSVYSQPAGYGFEPGASVTCKSRDEKTSLSEGLCTSDKPFYFSAALPEGNYRVSISFGNKQAATSTVIKAELRRLMLEKVETAKGKFVTKSFIVNIRTPQISTDGEVKLKDREKTSERWAWDEKLTLEFNGSRPTVTAIEIQRVDVPTIFLLGDSTVSDQPSEPYASWGQMITRFFGSNVAVANHAESGESLKSSFGGRRLDKVLSLIKTGDTLMIQYGHNDMKEKGEGIGAFTSYKASLQHFVQAAKKKGSSVILINPMHRRTFDGDGKIVNSHGDYPEAVRQAAREEKVPLIDLTAMSQDLYETLGKDGSGSLFKDGDGTHHNNYGSYLLAKCIVQAIRDQRLPMAKHLIRGLPRFDPKKPDDLKTFAIPASPAVTNLKPLGN